jgi:hypothetical protein
MRSRSTRRVVVAISNATFATNARASDTRHPNGRPTQPNERGTNRSSRAISKTVTKPKGNPSYWSALRSQDTSRLLKKASSRRLSVLAGEFRGLVATGTVRRTLGGVSGWHQQDAWTAPRRRLYRRIRSCAPPSSGLGDEELRHSGEVVGGERQVEAVRGTLQAGKPRLAPACHRLQQPKISSMRLRHF